MKCKRCGAEEDRIHGYCSVRCEELHELEQENERLQEIEEKYSELILHVETKFIKGETRHQTALRYIKEAENRNAIGTQKAFEEK